MNPAVRHESQGHRFWTSDDPSQNHQAAVARVIHSFHEATSDQPFTLNELSRIAALSRFHFSRVFHRLVGVPPVLFQSLLRLDAARRLLATTDCSVLDISLDLGFQSLGTFTRRFTDAIGMSPSRFRRLSKQIRIERVNSPARPNQRFWSPVVPVARSVSGVVKAPAGFGSGLIFIGLFDSPVPRGHPVRCCVLNRPGTFAISNVEDGDYYLMAAAFPNLTGGLAEVVQDNLLRAANDDGPISIRNGVKVAGSTALALRERHIFDPPILTALIPLLIDPSRCSFERTSNLGEENRGRFDS